jgi:hypothetical protein
MAMSFQESDWLYTCYTNDPYPEVQEWCEHNIGEFGQDWYKLGEDIMAMSMNPSTYKSTYMFKDGKHAVLFMLRWQ